ENTMPPRFLPFSTLRVQIVNSFVSLLVLLFLTCSASAQDTVTGAFEGTVTDSRSGMTLKDAAVDIINRETGLTFKLHTDSRGRFYQGLLIPGVYKIRVELAGYQPHEVLQRLKITYTGEVVPVPVYLDPLPASGPPPSGSGNVLGVEDTDIRA